MPHASSPPIRRPTGGDRRRDCTFLHRPADLRHRHLRRHRAGGRRGRVHAAGGAVSRRDAAHGAGDGRLPGRQRPDRARHRGGADRGAGQRRRGHDVHVVAVHQRRRLHPDRHVQAGHRLGHGPGAGAEPRLAGPAGHPGPGAERGHQRQEDVAQHADDRQPDLAGRPLRRASSSATTPRSTSRTSWAGCPGVAGITYLGQRDYSMRAWLDPDKLAALNLSAMDVVTAIAQQNVQVAAGQIGQQPVPQGPAVPAHHQHAGPAHRPGAVRRHHRQGRPRATRRRSRPAAARPARPPTGGSSTRPAGDRAAARPTAPAPQATGDRPAARRGPRRTGLAAVRPVLHARRPAVRGAVHLSAARLQRPGHRRRRLRQDEGAEDALSRTASITRSSTTPRPSSASRSTRSSTRCATR